jgi:hypothetical protein
VSGISPDPEIAGCFIVEFYDNRAAAEASAAANYSSLEAHFKDYSAAPYAGDFLAAPPGLGMPPQSGYTSKTAKPSPVPLGHSGSATMVLIRGVPNAICANKLCVEAMLEQAGLATYVQKFKFQQGRPCGEVQVSLNPVAVEHCKKHFNGMQWDPAMPVCVMEVPSKTWAVLDQVEPARISLPNKGPSRNNNSKNSRQFVAPRHLAKITEPETEESTDAGASEDEVDRAAVSLEDINSTLASLSMN